MMRFAAVLAALLITQFGNSIARADDGLPCATQGAPAIPPIKGLTYDQARPQLLAAGWIPARGKEFGDLSNNQTIFHDRGYTEVRACTVDGSAICKFSFSSKSGLGLKIVTHGDENPLLQSHAIVRSVELACAAGK